MFVRPSVRLFVCPSFCPIDFMTALLFVIVFDVFSLLSASNILFYFVLRVWVCVNKCVYVCVSLCTYECVLKSSANFSFAVFITLFYMAFGGVIIFVFVTAAAVAAADVSVIAIVCEHQQPLHLSIYIVYMCVRACVCWCFVLNTR